MASLALINAEPVAKKKHWQKPKQCVQLVAWRLMKQLSNADGQKNKKMNGTNTLLQYSGAWIKTSK